MPFRRVGTQPRGVAPCGDRRELQSVVKAQSGSKGQTYEGESSLPSLALRADCVISWLACAALCMAIAVRGGAVGGVIFRTDQGSEYTGNLLVTACRSAGVTQSMGRTG